MNAHVPLNIAAVRVSKNDRTNIVSNFKGRTAVFEEMPYLGTSTKASTGDMIVQPGPMDLPTMAAVEMT